MLFFFMLPLHFSVFARHAQRVIKSVFGQNQFHVYKVCLFRVKTLRERPFDFYGGPGRFFEIIIIVIIPGTNFPNKNIQDGVNFALTGSCCDENNIQARKP